MIEPFHGMDDVVVAPSAVILAKTTLPFSSEPSNPAARESSLKTA